MSKSKEKQYSKSAIINNIEDEMNRKIADLLIKDNEKLTVVQVEKRINKWKKGRYTV